MAVVKNRAPRGTRALVDAILDALDAIPEAQRKAAFKHASATVKEKLIARAEKAKAASRRAPRQPGAKMAAAVAATRKAVEDDPARRGSGPARSRRMVWTH